MSHLNAQQNHPLYAETEWPYRSIFDTLNDGVMIQDLESGFILEANPAACKMHGYRRDEFIGQPTSLFVHPASQHRFDEYMRSFRLDSPFEVQILHVRQDGSTFPAEWSGMGITFQGHSCLVGIIRDTSKRIQTEQDLHHRAETRTHEQAKLLEISLILASTLEFQPELILGQLSELIEFTQGGVFELQDSTLVSLALKGRLAMGEAPHTRIHLNDSDTVAALFNGHKPINIGDLMGPDTHASLIRSILVGEAEFLLEGMASWLWAPMVVRGRLIGGIAVAHENRNYFTSHQANLALSVAHLAAMSMTNAVLFRDAQALAIMDERQRLARNLHDAINQSLFSAGLIAEVLPRLWERDQDEARLAIGDLLHLIRGGQAEMRALLAELRPSTLTDSNLGDLLRLSAHALTGRTNLPVDVTINHEIILPAEVQVAFYRVCQESLNNVAKHANASRVEIRLEQDKATTEMWIRDNGRGFDLSQISSGHYGVSMMRERAETVGAILRISSIPGRGTILNLSWTESPHEVSI